MWSPSQSQATAHTTLGAQPALPQRLGIDILGGSQLFHRDPGRSGHHHQASRILPNSPPVSHPCDELLDSLLFGRVANVLGADVEGPVVVYEDNGF
jgi:hypothetical protein